MTREQLMSKPATLSKLIVIGLLGALSLLLLEIRFEHREVLGEAWQSWIPLLYSGAMLALGAAALNGPASLVENHSHSVVVSSAQLSSISAGQTVQVTSGTADGHTHLFTFLKLA